MIITVDSNVLLSVFTEDSLYKRSSALLEKYNLHEYIINDCIYLELGVYFENVETLNKSLNILEVNLVEEYERDYDVVLIAWIRYLERKKFVCPSCKKAINPVCPQCHHRIAFRQRILPDFLVGGFAFTNSNGIVTLDPVYYKNYFPQLKIFE